MATLSAVSYTHLDVYKRQPEPSANHFDIHVGVGLSIYVSEHFFIRPQFDLHYAPGLGGVNNQFNSNLVPAGMVWVGYSFGDR